jgi:hypothetical protein
MPRKFTVVQNLPELLDLYRKAAPLFTDEAGKPDRNGSFIRSPDGKFSRVMAMSGSCAAPGAHSGRR